MGLIYKITSPSSRIYIGQTINFNKRIKSYKNTLAKDQPKLNFSFLKYGFEKHIIEIIQDDIEDIDLDKIEEFYIKFFNCVETGLNCTYDAISPMKGRKHSIISKLKMSKTRKGRIYGPPSEQHLLNLSNSIKEGFRKGRKGCRLGVKLSDDTKLKCRNAKLGKLPSEETRKKLSIAGLNRRHSLETINNMKLSRSINKVSIENIIKIKEELLQKQLTLKEVAFKYNSSISTISLIKNNKGAYKISI